MARSPRSAAVDPRKPTVVHVMSRCARGLHLLESTEAADAGFCPKRCCTERLSVLARTYAIDVAGFCLMGNHFHLVLKTQPDAAQRWSARTVVGRWLNLHPGRKVARMNDREREAHEATLAADVDWVEQHRAKLSSLSFFLKDFKQHVAETYNAATDSLGSFWQGRFRMTVPRDDEGVLAVMAYVDLNPCAAGLAAAPDEAKHTGLRARLEEGAGSAGARPHRMPPRPAGGRRVARFLSEVCWGMPRPARDDGRVVLRMPLGFGQYVALLRKLAERLRRSGRPAGVSGSASAASPDELTRARSCM